MCSRVRLRGVLAYTVCLKRDIMSSFCVFVSTQGVVLDNSDVLRYRTHQRFVRPVRVDEKTIFVYLVSKQLILVYEFRKKCSKYSGVG